MVKHAIRVHSDGWGNLSATVKLTEPTSDPATLKNARRAAQRAIRRNLAERGSIGAGYAVRVTKLADAEGWTTNDGLLKSFTVKEI